MSAEPTLRLQYLNCLEVAPVCRDFRYWALSRHPLVEVRFFSD